MQRITIHYTHAVETHSYRASFKHFPSISSSTVIQPLLNVGLSQSHQLSACYCPYVVFPSLLCSTNTPLCLSWSYSIILRVHLLSAYLATWPAHLHFIFKHLKNFNYYFFLNNGKHSLSWKKWFIRITIFMHNCQEIFQMK